MSFVLAQKCIDEGRKAEGRRRASKGRREGLDTVLLKTPGTGATKDSFTH